eukprot:6976911-Prymnesium_polylepis.2
MVHRVRWWRAQRRTAGRRTKVDARLDRPLPCGEVHALVELHCDALEDVQDETLLQKQRTVLDHLLQGALKSDDRLRHARDCPPLVRQLAGLAGEPPDRLQNSEVDNRAGA